MRSTRDTSEPPWIVIFRRIRDDRLSLRALVSQSILIGAASRSLLLKRLLIREKLSRQSAGSY